VTKTSATVVVRNLQQRQPPGTHRLRDLERSAGAPRHREPPRSATPSTVFRTDLHRQPRHAQHERPALVRESTEFGNCPCDPGVPVAQGDTQSLQHPGDKVQQGALTAHCVHWLLRGPVYGVMQLLGAATFEVRPSDHCFRGA
jgi:hypothetical protein